MVDDPAAEGLPLTGVVDRQVERGLGDAGRDGGDAESAGVQRRERDRQTVALVAQQPISFDPDPSKFIVAVGEPVSPILCSGGSAVSPSASAGTRKQEMPRVSSEVRIMLV